MSVKINISAEMLQLTDNERVVEVEGATVGECLNNLIARFPDIRPALLDKNGGVLDYVDIFVNGKSSFPQELAMPVKDGDEMHIVRILAGG